MLFLRIAWIVAQAGVGLSLLIIFISTVVCIVTTLSLSAICTNGELQGGGVYYLVSRSLGAELGASVGIIFAFANAVAASMNTIGFCDSLNELLRSNGLKIIDNDVNDVRIVGAIALFVMCFICAVGMDWETKTQNFLIIVIVLAIVNYVIGACIGPSTDLERAQGFVGLSFEQINENWYPDYRVNEGEEYNFFTVFAMYFPSVTGVQAGANICGDLRHPASAIPKGTLMALAISTASYLTMALLAGAGALRDASGNPGNLSREAITDCAPNCDYGLHNNYSIMQLMSLWSPMIYCGCWAATLSTALTNLLSVPRLIQALGTDRIYPGLIYFSKPYGRHGEPYRGYVLVFIVSLLFLLIADLNKIAPLITNFYLASYALINFCTFHAAFVKPLSWRPTFKYYNTWLSLSGFLMCMIIMMIISWMMALCTVFIFVALFLLVLYRNPEANWGSSTEAQRYQDVVTSLIVMLHRPDNIKLYNPQLLVLAGLPFARPTLLDVGHLITKVGSFMLVADISKKELSVTDRLTRVMVGNKWLNKRKNRGFYVVLDDQGLVNGVKVLIQTSGLGRLSPNVLFMGYKYKWMKTSLQELVDYVHIIQIAFENQLGVCILRVPESARSVKRVLGTQSTSGSGRMPPASDTHVRTTTLTVMHADSNTDISNVEIVVDKKDHEDEETTRNSSLQITNNRLEELPSKRSRGTNSISTNAIFFKQKASYKPLTLLPNVLHHSLDAWWLYDDGGLNILLPYIIAQRSLKDKLPMRIFALAKGQAGHSQKQMESLLLKFRIKYASLTILNGVNESPSESSWELFNNLIEDFKVKNKHEFIEGQITDDDIKKANVKTKRHLRLREMLLEHSSTAAFIVITLPLPRKNSIPAALYMCWLEVLSRDLPPTLFVRGNDASVLTFAA